MIEVTFTAYVLLVLLVSSYNFAAPVAIVSCRILIKTDFLSINVSVIIYVADHSLILPLPVYMYCY